MLVSEGRSHVEAWATWVAWRDTLFPILCQNGRSGVFLLDPRHVQSACQSSTLMLMMSTSLLGVDVLEAVGQGRRSGYVDARRPKRERGCVIGTGEKRQKLDWSTQRGVLPRPTGTRCKCARVIVAKDDQDDHNHSARPTSPCSSPKRKGEGTASQAHRP